MIRTITLDKTTTELPYTCTEWDQRAIERWMLFHGKINKTMPFERIDNADGTITFEQDQGAPAIRIYAGLSAIQ